MHKCVYDIGTNAVANLVNILPMNVYYDTSIALYQ